MASSNATQRPAAAYLPPLRSTNPAKIYIPSTNDFPAIKTIRNLGKFSPHYGLFIWSVLFITLLWNQEISFLYLISVTKVAFFYFVLFHTLPDFVVLHKTAIDKRYVWFLFFVVLFLLLISTVFELILTQGKIFLFGIFAAIVPIILLHAVLTKEDDMLMLVSDEVPIVLEKGSGGLPENMV